MPSVDYLGSKVFPARHGLSVCVCDSYPRRAGPWEPRMYDLAALPLALEAGDGSPVRAVLKKKG
ncbi:hypothetical protein ACXM0N_10150 [Peribacillus simplex]